MSKLSFLLPCPPHPLLPTSKLFLPKSKVRGSTKKGSVTDIAMDLESRSDDAPPTGAVNGRMTAQEFFQAENKSVKKPSDFAEGRGRADEARGPELQHPSNQTKGSEQDAIIATDSSSTFKSPGPSSNNDDQTPSDNNESNHPSPDAAAITTPKLTKGYYTTPSFLGSLAAIGLSAISGIGGFALPAALLATINADIGPSASITWVSIVYLVTQTIGQLILGRLTDLFGRRWFFFGCSMLALIGSIICARAQSVNVLIGGNTIMGLASAAQMSFPYLVTEIVPINWRFFSMAYVYTIAIPFTGIGPVVADAFATHTSAGWRGIYYMFIGINVAAASCFYFFYYPPTFALKHSRDKLTRKQVLADFDYVGLVVFTGGLLVFLLGLSWGGTLHAWNSSWTIATIVVGGVAVVAFGLWEAYAPIREPLVPPHLFRSWGWVATVMVLSLGVCLYYSFYLVWPSQVAALYSDNESKSYIAWLSCAASGPYLFGTISTQLSFRAIGHAKIQVITMTILATAFIAGTSSSPISTSVTIPFSDNHRLRKRYCSQQTHRRDPASPRKLLRRLVCRPDRNARQHHHRGPSRDRRRRRRGSHFPQRNQHHRDGSLHNSPFQPLSQRITPSRRTRSCQSRSAL